MINDPEFRKNLLVSLVTSVLVLIFVEPILKLSANGLMWLGANISESFTKSVYSSAALGLREKYSFISLMLILSMLAGAATGAIASSLRTRSTGHNHPTTSRNGFKKFINILVASVMIFSGLNIMASNFIELQLNASFSQRLTVLSAKIPEQQVRDLRASWALMSGRSDYEAITAEMNRLAAAAQVKLPAALWD